MPEIVVHHLERSRSQRILWLLEELELPYEIKVYARDPRTMRAPASLREIHPLGKAPVVSVDGVVLAESGAIIEHLTESLGGGRLRPEDPADLQVYRFWLHYAEGSFMPPQLVRLIFDKIKGPPVPFFLRPLTRAIAAKVEATYTAPEIDRHLAFVDYALSERPWLVGDALTAADIQMSYPLEASMARRPGAKEDREAAAPWPHIASFLERARARPAYQRAEERGGAFGIPS